MNLSKKAYEELKDYLLEEDINFTWDCGNDSTLIDFGGFDDSYDEVFDYFVETYDLPNATSGFYITGQGTITIDEEGVISYSVQAEEVDPEDPYVETFDLPLALSEFSKKEYKYDIEVELELSHINELELKTVEDYDFYTRIEPKYVEYGVPYQIHHFSDILKIAVKEVKDMSKDIDNGVENETLNYLKIQLQYVKSDEERHTCTLFCYYSKIESYLSEGEVTLEE